MKIFTLSKKYFLEKNRFSFTIVCMQEAAYE